MHHPWRAFGRLTDWKLRWSPHLPWDIAGHTDHDGKTITLAVGLDQAERRCTIAHESEHALRGAVPDFYWPREERAIDDIVSRKMIAIEDLADAMKWTHDPHELADELWVDVDTVKARLANLTDSEGRQLDAMLDQAEQQMPVTEP